MFGTAADTPKAINERIKELDFRDCKVRVTNVDSQASDSNIVIQVIGEISNKSQPHKKFTQTFVLAGQTNGYFVLNDIFRYMVEEEEEEEAESEQTQRDAIPSGFQEPAPTATHASEPETLTSSQDPAAIEKSAHKVDEELESEVVHSEPSRRESPPPNRVDGEEPLASDDLVQATEAPVAAPLASGEEEARPEAHDVEAQTAQATAEPEKPKDPEPTPALSPVKQAAQPASTAAAAPAPAPAKPSAPKTWANLAAAAHRVVTPAVPAPQQVNTPAPATQQSKAAPVPATAGTSSTAPSAAPASKATAPRDESPSKQEDEWTNVGDNKKQQSRTQAHQTAANVQEGPQTRAYIKNVHEGIDADELRAVLEKSGEVVYYDVHRGKVGSPSCKVTN